MGEDQMWRWKISVEVHTNNCLGLNQFGLGEQKYNNYGTCSIFRPKYFFHRPLFRNKLDKRDKLGFAAQIKVMKQVGGKLKLELAQFVESKAFAQFASDLDKATHNQLARGQRLRELLIQSQSSPLTVEEQILTIYTRTNVYLDSL
ncbi:hypothetical protein R6Q57_004764 [Mikania cordata]